MNRQEQLVCIQALWEAGNWAPGWIIWSKRADAFRKKRRRPLYTGATKKGVNNMAVPQRCANRVRFTVVVADTTFQALENAQGDRTWRQLAQQAIREYAAKLAEEPAPVEMTQAAQ